MSFPGLFSYQETTEGITVRVQVHYGADESEPERKLWLWHYHVRIENGSGFTVKLMDRHWVIVDGDGARRDVMGEGVVGEQPVIPPGKSFDYVSGCALHTPKGDMHGRYGMQDHTGRRFEIAIPRFHLRIPAGPMRPG